MPKRGEPATPAQREAAKRNLAKGRKKRSDALKKGGMPAHERWAMLLDGRLTVKDLDDDELENVRVKGVGGVFNGKRRTVVPSHIAQAMAAERQERWKRDVMAGVPNAIAALNRIIDDDEHKDQAKLVQWVIERALGKTPDVVQIRTTGFDAVADQSIDTNRALDREAEAMIAEASDG